MAFKDMMVSIGRKKRAKAAQKRVIKMGVAVATGVVAGILLATKKGKEVRAGLKQEALKTGRAIKSTFGKKREEVIEKVKEAKEKA